MKTSNLVLLGSLISGNLVSQLNLSLHQAIQLVREANPVLRIAWNNHEAARHQARQYLSVGLPWVSATGNYLYNIQPQQFLLPGEFFGQPGSFQTVSAAPPFQATIGVNASMKLVDGSYIFGLKASSLLQEIRKTEAERTEQMLVRQVIENYFQALFLRSQLALLQEDMADAQKIALETSEYVAKGFRELQDKRLVQFAADTLTLAHRRLEAAYESVMLNLKTLLHRPLQEKLLLSDSLEGLVAKLPHREILEDTLSPDLGKTLEMKILRLNTKALSLNEKAEFARFFPSLNTFFNWGYGGFSNDKKRPVLFSGDSRYFASGTVWGLGLSIPLFSSFNRLAGYRLAKIQTENARLQEASTAAALEAQARILKIQYRLALESLQQARKNLQLQEDIRHTQRLKYREGLLTSFELTQTDAQYRAARRAVLQAQLQLLMLHTAYRYLTGNLNFYVKP
ncbi:MAG: TolC family protein [Flavobacteriales bacterium]|nr:TolC family protein [Flavobacteriales bacterium]